MHHAPPDIMAMLPLFSARALDLALWFALALPLGEMLLRPASEPVAAFFSRLFSALQRKLDRTDRPVGRRLYRGLIVAVLWLAAALTAGYVATYPLRPLLPLLLLLLLGRQQSMLEPLRQFLQWRGRRLELAYGGQLYNDGHGVLRASISDSAERFAVLVGLCLWFVLAGPMAMLLYAALMLGAAHSGAGPYSWALRESAGLLDAPPRLLAGLLLGFAGLFVPGTHPLRAFGEWDYRARLCALLGISLEAREGKHAPASPRGWIGRGTAQLEGGHLLRWVLVRSIGWLIGLLGLVVPATYTMLFHK